MERELNFCNKWIEWAMIGEKVTSYRMPIVIEKISDYNDFVTIYTKGFEKCLSVDKKSFLSAIEKYNGGHE